METKRECIGRFTNSKSLNIDLFIKYDKTYHYMVEERWRETTQKNYYTFGDFNSIEELLLDIKHRVSKEFSKYPVENINEKIESSLVGKNSSLNNLLEAALSNIAYFDAAI
ncbi:hypothetical protein JOC77_002978 [Peribacillus deserti]|uniref:Uncharacterized protein n=1 Tax=Peribacillus deserti TaxID=673318 RepID=A0ABS2QK54_9BACI|nr:hypothetical protein [Peribacillus deserti]MBM7693538.1 hypothetical protein [Peribacillus deserti]